MVASTSLVIYFPHCEVLNPKNHVRKQRITDTYWKQVFNRGRVIMFSATFNNISIISWRSVLLLEKTGVPGENRWPAASHRQTLSHNVVSSTPLLFGIRTYNFSGDKYWLHRQLYIQLPYNHDHDSPHIQTSIQINQLIISIVQSTFTYRFLTWFLGLRTSQWGK